SGFFNLELQAHTDLQGNKHFNERLSFERRKAVEDMLVLKGIPSQMIQGYHFGEERPLVKVSETEDVPENRRVDILVRYHKFEGIEDVFSYTNQNNISQVLFTNDGSQLIEGISGTQLIIPNEAFQTKDGKCISNKGVVFEL